MADKHPHYWQVKAAAMEAQLIQAQAQAAVNAARAKEAKALTDAGLDPTVSYELIDADEAIVPRRQTHAAADPPANE